MFGYTDYSTRKEGKADGINDECSLILSPKKMREVYVMKKMRKFVAALLAMGITATAAMSFTASAADDTDYLLQIKVDTHYGIISNIEVNTTIGQIMNELIYREIYNFDIPTNRSEKARTEGTFPLYLQGKYSYATLIVNGDVNCDGLVDDSDRDMMLRYIAATGSGDLGNNIISSSWRFAAADLDGNGKINMSDVLDISKIINRHAND